MKGDSRLLRWVADHAHNVFWGVWGAGFGAFGMVLSKAIDPAGVTPPSYLGILTVLMGGALGLLTSRTMDHLTDKRKQRRKYSLARYRMRALVQAILPLIQFMKTVTQNGTVAIPATGAGLTVEQVHQFAVLTTRVLWRAKTIPDFEDLIEGDDDHQPVDHATSVFETCVTLFSAHNANNINIEEARIEMAHRVTARGITLLEGFCATLRATGNHFQSRYN